MEVDGQAQCGLARNNRGRNAHKDKLKLTFAHGRACQILTSSSTRARRQRVRAIDLFEGDKI